MKNIHGAPHAEIILCRQGILLVKTEEFFTLDHFLSWVLLATERKANLPDLHVFGDHLQY